ncbi:MAG: polysulfide reductase NrfD [Bacteroidales bacterium]|nr:polysulfide reductase NrfD [Bacteroidales bacterium]
MAESQTNIQQDSTVDNLIKDLFRTVRLNKGFNIWMGFLSVSLVICLYAYYIQLRDGLGVAGIRDYVSWGIYISNFVFFVATSLVGMLVSGVVGLSGQKWVTPLTRIAEIIAVAFAAVAGLVIVSDMGRPERLVNVFIHGRVQSPILWDVTVVTTYFLISLLLLYITLIPDLAYGKDHLEGRPKLLQKLYDILSLGWKGRKAEVKILKKSTIVMLILIIPVALSIHTVTSWLFAVTLRPGWDSSIFGPYFVSGAFVSGLSCLVIAMYFFRKNYKLEDYITDFHFDKVAKLLVLVSLVYLYFNLNEFLVPGYKMKKFDAVHLRELLAGEHALLFWSVQGLGLIIPIILLLIKPFRKPLPMLIIGIFVLAGSWLKRYIIVVPVQEHPFLPIQHEPSNFMVYSPTLIEILISIAPIIMVLMIISVLAKLFPIIPVWETVVHKGLIKDETEIENNNHI